MNKKPRVVLDTNVLIRAAFRKRSSLTNRIYQALKGKKFILIMSSSIMEEIEDVINRDYILKYTKMTQAERTYFIQYIHDVSIYVSGTTIIKKKSRDSKDDKFLVCAAEAQADYIVTTDKDLLELDEHEGTKIIIPQEFVKFLDKNEL